MGEITPELVLAALTPRTKLVALASCHYLSGFRLDYENIGEELHRRGVLFCLDAIQSLGATTLDVLHIDFLAADSHKWMLGPLGAGIFYVKRRHFETLRPTLVGAWNVVSPGFVAQPEIVFENSARRYEPGRAEPPRPARHEGQPRAHPRPRREADRGTAARPAQLLRGQAPRPWVQGHRLRQPPLAEMRHHGTACIRLSPHFYNTEDEIEEVIKIMGS